MNYFTISFNLSKIIVLFALISAAEGNKIGVARLVDECVKIYQYSVRDLRKDLVLVNELSESHKAVVKLLSLRKSLEKGDDISDNITECFNVFSRLLSNREKLLKNFLEIYCE
jgi:hypothetical protein